MYIYHIISYHIAPATIIGKFVLHHKESYVHPVYRFMSRNNIKGMGYIIDKNISS